MTLDTQFQQAKQFIEQGQYAQAALFLEEAIAADPAELIHYWYLGLAQLYAGAEDEAQMTWATPLLNAESEEQAEQWTADLVQFLLAEATQRSRSSDHAIAAQLGQICVQLTPENARILWKVASLLKSAGGAFLLDSIAVAEQAVDCAQQPEDRLTAISILLGSWMSSGGPWQRSLAIYQDFKALLAELAENCQPQDAFINLLSIGSYLFYFEDNPQHNRPLRNRLGKLGQTHIQTLLKRETDRYAARLSPPSSKTRLPKIGYLSESFRQHSVGWLCRWLLRHHDRDRFEIHLYSTAQADDFIQQNLIQIYGDRFHSMSNSIPAIANQIYKDDIDILIELDSLSSLGGCGVLALKPAPVQVHWLGYDASGIPAVDYFIADRYVLPDDASSYYQEKIWRLPQSYIAIDGFEVGVPSLRRKDLGIPGDAVVYLSSQTGYKRNPDNVRLQLQILKAVPNSYFLIKSFRANLEFVEQFFQELAAAEGVSGDRLRFLPDVPSELVHRANLGLADVVLDTYPYNGATTTLEALWMGLPIVTLVGEQFAARNSYTLLMNVGVQEGIAWTEHEYLEWGVRLGEDASLRQTVTGKLRRSRHTAPLWNAQQFARDMEAAYEQMWANYCTE